MDEQLIQLMKETLPMIKALHGSMADHPLHPWAYIPAFAALVSLIGALWIYHKSVIESKDKTITQLVDKVDEARGGERTALEAQIARNETQFEKLSEMTQAIRDTASAVERLGG